MAKMHFLGTCSGTEPFENMHHCSWVLEVNGVNYWFDAGESCSYTAHLSGIDVTHTAAIFVSHAHYDHTGGLVDLLGCMTKLCRRRKIQMIRNNHLVVWFPDFRVWEAIKIVFGGTTTGKNTRQFPFEIEEHETKDGTIFEDENVKVIALHNNHLREDGADGWHSYSFCIEVEGKRLVYSGDVKEPAELDALIGEGCDVLIMETGHHKVSDVCNYAVSRNVKHLRFNHHGREIINERPQCEKVVADFAAANNISIKICYDGMAEEL